MLWSGDGFHYAREWIQSPKCDETSRFFIEVLLRERDSLQQRGDDYAAEGIKVLDQLQRVTRQFNETGDIVANERLRIVQMLEAGAEHGETSEIRSWCRISLASYLNPGDS